MEKLAKFKKVSTKTKTAYSSFINLYSQNMKLTLRLKSVIIVGTIFLAVGVLFNILMALDKGSLPVLSSVNFMLSGVMLGIFTTLVSVYLIRSQQKHGIHHIELRAGIKPFMTYTIRFLVAMSVIFLYITIYFIIAQICGIFATSSSQYLKFFCTSGAAFYFFGCFYCCINFLLAAIAKTSVAVALGVFFTLLMSLGSVCGSIASSAADAINYDEARNANLSQKMGFIDNVNNILHYTNDFKKVVNKNNLNQIFFDNPETFLVTAQNQFNKNPDLWNKNGAIQFDPSIIHYSIGGGVDQTAGVFGILWNDGRPYFLDTTGANSKVVIGENDNWTNPGLGNLLKALTAIAYDDAIANGFDKTNVILDEDLATKSDLNFFNYDMMSIGDNFVQGQYQTFANRFKNALDRYISNHQNNSDPEDVNTYNFIVKNQNNLKTFLTTLIPVIKFYEQFRETSFGSFGLDSSEYLPSVFTTGMDDYNSYLIPGIDKSSQPQNNNLVLNRYYNAYPEFNVFISAIISGYQDIRMPLVYCDFLINKTDNNGNHDDSIANNTYSLQQAMPFYNKYVKMTQKRMGASLHLHFSQIFAGYSNKADYDNSFIGWRSFLCYNFTRTYIKLSDKIVPSQKSSKNLSKDAPVLAINSKTVKAKTLWSYGGLVTCYLIFAFLMLYLGALAHKKRMIN